MKKLLRNALKCLLFLIAAALLWLFVRDTLVMKRDDGITSMKIYYQQPAGSIDVLFLGSSHCSYNIAAEEMWNTRGISFYQLWGSSQPMWNTYHFLVEALKTQEPKVVAVDVYGALMMDDYADEARQATNTLGMNISRNQIENIMVSAPSSRWMDLFLGLPIYHDRFSELAEDDFQYYPWSRGSVCKKGGEAVYGTHNNVNLTYQRSEARLPLSEKQETYLRKIIDLCAERSIPLVFLVTPTAERAKEQPYYNTISDICEETGTPFLNMNLLGSELGILPEDISLDDSHLNMNGARKTGLYLAAYFDENYDLEDHRQDPAYESFETYAAEKAADYLRQITDPEDYTDELIRQGYSVLAVRFGTGSSAARMYPNLPGLKELSGNAAYVLQNGTWEAYQPGEPLFGTELTVDFVDRCFAINLILDPYWSEEGTVLAVYDNRHEKWIDAVYSSDEEPETMEHLEFRKQ